VRDFPPSHLDFRALMLAPLSFLYMAGWAIYEMVYKLGWKKPAEPHPRVLVVGNLTVGGMGKSPITVYIAKTLIDMGYHVLIGVSGYGSPRSQAATMAPDGPLDPAEWGDEPAMIRDLLPSVPMVVGRRRVLAAELAYSHAPDSILLMDDGFQHKPLKKHVSILIDPPKSSNPLCLPAGPYREPKWHRSRADILIPDQVGFIANALPLSNGTGEEFNFEGNEKVSILTAIANPDRLVHTVMALGGKPSKIVFKPDHDPLNAGNLLDEFDPTQWIIVTHKDWVKLRRHPKASQFTILYLPMVTSAEDDAAFRALLESKLNGIQANKRT
jgi:tetraacyldisaccharide 4'-kinase